MPRHNKVCKLKTQLHLIAIEECDTSDTKGEEHSGPNPAYEEDKSPELQISLHAILGTISAIKTFPLFINIDNMKLVALTDSGSSASFMDPSLIIRTSLPLENHEPVKVTMANGNVLWAQAGRPGCQYTIQDHKFTPDFRVLDMEGYDLILGCD
jgi:hypothetical protein